MSAISRPRVPTLEKIVTLLRLFTLSDPRWRLAEIARELDWDKATALRILRALVETRFLEREEDGSYQIGILPVELGSVYLSIHSQRRRLLNEMQRIAEATNRTTQIGVLHGRDVTIIASQEARSAVRAAAMLGARLPAHASAVGKAILSQLSDQEIRQRLPAKLERFTDTTIVSRDVLLKQCAAVRETGLAFVDGEFDEGLYAVAVSIPHPAFGSGLAGLTCAGAPPSIVPEAWKRARKLLTDLTRDWAEFASDYRLPSAAAGRTR